MKLSEAYQPKAVIYTGMRFRPVDSDVEYILCRVASSAVNLICTTSWASHLDQPVVVENCCHITAKEAPYIFGDLDNWEIVEPALTETQTKLTN
jgi:hypothetical protein